MRFSRIIPILIGEGCDALIFITIGFFGTISIDALISMIIVQAMFKTIYK